MTTAEKIKKHFGNKPVVWAAAWGISKLRKRGGRFAGSIDGDALWYDEWYNRVMSEEGADKLAELGVNLIVLPFSVGGSAEIEKEERDDFERMAAVFHKRGIVSLPYIQYQNILQEACSLPGAEWAVNFDGMRTQYCYWRRTVCQSGRPFIDYFNGLTSDAAKRGADGIWIDNNYLKPCKCESCVSMFKDYLRKNRTDLLDGLFLKNFDNIEMPPQGLIEYPFDPIVQAYIDFNCERNMLIHRELKEHLEKVNPYGLFGSNPGVYRTKADAKVGTPYYEMAALNDLLYLENKFFPGKKDGHLSGNFRGFISSANRGTLGVPGAWKREDFDDMKNVHSSGLPETKEEIERVLFEAATFNGSPGMLWAVRTRPLYTCESEKDLTSMYFEWPQVHGHMKKAVSFLMNSDIFGTRKNMADIAVFHHRESLAFNHDNSYPSLHCVEDFLLENALPYNVVFSENIEEMKKYKLIILPEVTLLSDKEALIIRKYIAEGGKALAIGYPGTCNEKYKRRKDSPLNDVFNITVFRREKDFVENKFSKGETLYVPNNGKLQEKILNCWGSASAEIKYPRWTEKKAELARSFFKLLGDDRQIIVEGKETLGVSLSQKENGKILIQLLSYDDNPEKQKLRISVNKNISAEKSAEWLTPNTEKSSLKASVENNYSVYEADDFINYGILTIG